MSAVAYLISVALAHAATNFDNLAMVVVLAPLLGLGRSLAAYVMSQVIIGVAAVVFAVGLFHLVGGWIGLLGVFPIALGVYALLSDDSDDVKGRETAGSGVVGAVVMFLVLGVDTFSLMAPILGDTGALYFPMAVLGMGLSVVGLCIASVALVRTTHLSAALTHRLTRLAPFVMIAAGLYVLFDTPTDVI